MFITSRVPLHDMKQGRVTQCEVCVMFSTYYTLPCMPVPKVHTDKYLGRAGASPTLVMSIEIFSVCMYVYFRRTFFRTAYNYTQNSACSNYRKVRSSIFHSMWWCASQVSTGDREGPAQTENGAVVASDRGQGSTSRVARLCSITFKLIIEIAGQ